MQIEANRVIAVWVVSVLLALVVVVRVSAGSAPPPEAETRARSEQAVQAPEHSCLNLNEQGEQVDCWCVRAVAKAESCEISAIVVELDRHMATWRQENLLNWVTKPCLKRCAEAFDSTINRTAGEISRYEAANDLLSKLVEAIPQGLCPEAEKYNEQLMHYKCWLKRGNITDTQYDLLRRYGYNTPASNSLKRTEYLTNVRSRAAKRSCMFACCGNAFRTYPPSRTAD